MKKNTIFFIAIFSVNLIFVSNNAFAESMSSRAQIDNIVKKSGERKKKTGVFLYSVNDEAVLEKIILKEPNNIGALHMLAWVYSTYERNKNSKELHTKALDYAKRSYKICNGKDPFITEILGAAYYANGSISEGDRFFDLAIGKWGQYT